MDISVLYKIPTENVLWESEEEEDNDDDKEEVDNGSIDSVVDHVYIMNRIEDVANWSAVVCSIDNTFKYYTRYPKVNHEKSRHITDWNGGKCDTVMEYALNKTVRNILGHALEKGYESVMILNDTARFHSNTKMLFQTAYRNINRANSNWKVIHLGIYGEPTPCDKNFYYPNTYTKNDYAFIIRGVIGEIFELLKRDHRLDDIFKYCIKRRI